MVLSEIELDIINRKIQLIDKIIWLRLKRLERLLEKNIDSSVYDTEEQKVIEFLELFDTHVSEHLN